MSEFSTRDVLTAIAAGPDKICVDRDSNHPPKLGHAFISGSRPIKRSNDIDENISEYQHYPEIRTLSHFQGVDHSHNAQAQIPGIDMAVRGCRHCHRPIDWARPAGRELCKRCNKRNGGEL